MKQGNPQIEELEQLQNEPLHQYRGKHVKEQKGKGISAQGDKKLITDYAFYEDIIVKLHFLNQIQVERDQATGPPTQAQTPPLMDPSYEKVGQVKDKNRKQDSDDRARIGNKKLSELEKRDPNFNYQSGHDSIGETKEPISGDLKEQKIVAIEP